MLVGCGGDPVPVRPTAVEPPGWPAGTVLTIVSAADGRPVPGASVAVGGRTLPGDASGRVTLDARLPDFTARPRR